MNGVGIPETIVAVKGKSKVVSVCLINHTEGSIDIPKLQKVATIHAARVVDLPLNIEHLPEMCQIPWTYHI